MIRNREAVVLAGGFGTRLSHIVSDVPKPMAPVAGRPFLRFILDALADNGFEKVVVADGYKRECIEEYFGGIYRGMELVYSSEDSPLLTGGAVKQGLAYCSNDWVYVFNGDTYLDVDYAAFDDAVRDASEETVTLIAAKRMFDFDRYGTLEINDGIIRAFNEKKPCLEGVINAGVYLMRKSALDGLPDVFSLETGFFEKVVSEGRLKAVPCNGGFIDIGVPEDYELAQTMLASLICHWKLAMFDRDGTLNVDTGHLFEPEKLQLLDVGVELLRKYSSEDDLKIVVITNQAGIAKGLYTEADMHHLHNVMDEEFEKLGCRVDAWYFCPHHPDFTGECDCRKPAPGMLLKAMFDFDADPEDCILYGDKLSDKEAASAACVKFCWVGNNIDS